MSKEVYSGANIAYTQSFATLVERLNEIIYDMSTVIVTTASVSEANSTNGAQTIGNAYINGSLASDNLFISGSISGGIAGDFSNTQTLYIVSNVEIGNTSSNDRLSVYGTVILGSNTSDIISINGVVNTDIIPSGTRNLGDINSPWNDSVVTTMNIVGTTESTNTSSGALIVDGGIGVAKDLNIGGAASISDTLTVGGNSVFNGTVALGNATGDTVSINGFVNTHIIPSGTRNLGSVSSPWNDSVVTTMNIVGTTESTNTSSGALIVSGGAGIEKDLNVGGDANVIGSLTVTGDLILSSNNLALTLANTITSEMHVLGDLTVDGNSILNGNVYLGNAISDTISINGSVNTHIRFSANTTYDIGNNTLRPNRVYGANAYFNNGVFVGNVSLGDASGDVISINGSVNTNIIPSGTRTLGNASFPWNEATITSTKVVGTIESTTTSTGALIVSGGVGIAKNLNIGGSLVVTNNFTASNNVSLGLNTADIISINGSVNTHIRFSANTTYDIGNNTLRPNRVYGANAYFNNGVFSSDIIALVANVNTRIETPLMYMKNNGVIRFYDSSAINYISLSAPSSLSNTYTFTLPDSYGANGQAMITDGNGGFSFADISSTMNISGDSGSDTVNLGTDIFAMHGANGINVAITANATHSIATVASPQNISQTSGPTFANLTITSTTAEQTIYSTNNTATNSANLTFRHVLSSPSDGDALGGIFYKGDNTVAQNITYVNIRAYAKDVTDNTEDGQIDFNAMIEGTSRTLLQMNNQAGQVDLYYANSSSSNIRLQTTVNGITVTGNVIADNFSGTANNALNLGGVDASSYLTANSIISNNNVDGTYNMTSNNSLYIGGNPAANVVYVTGAQSIGGIKTFSSNTVFNAAIKENVYVLSGTTPALNPGNGTVQTQTLTGTTTYSDGLSAGQSMILMIDDGSSQTVVWPTITWVNNGGLAPTLSTTNYTVVVIWKVGSTLYGAFVGNGE